MPTAAGRRRFPPGSDCSSISSPQKFHFIAANLSRERLTQPGVDSGARVDAMCIKRDASKAHAKFRNSRPLVGNLHICGVEGPCVVGGEVELASNAVFALRLHEFPDRRLSGPRA